MEVDVEVGGYKQRIDGTPIVPVVSRLLARRDVTMVKADDRVAGRVVNADGKPVKGATVSALSGGDETTANAAGRFRVGGLVAGPVLMEVTTSTGAGAFAQLMSGTSDGAIRLDAPEPHRKSDDQPVGLG